VRRLSLTAWIFIALIVGTLIGYLFPGWSQNLKVISDIFLRLIKSVLAPLLFGTLVVGIAHLGDVRTVGRIGAKAIAYFEIVTTLALVVGLLAVHVVQPGVGLELNAGSQAEVRQPPTFSQVLEHTFPSSVIDAMARGEILQIVVFSVIFGLAAAVIGPKARPILDFCESLSEVMFKYTGYVMYLAPLAVAASLAVTVGRSGLGPLAYLGKLVLTLYGALVVFVVAVLVPVMLICKIPIRRFIGFVKEPWLIAFSTATSEAALPLALKNMEKFGVPKQIVGFVLPTGYSFNLDGSTLYLSLAAIFVSQAAGITLTVGQQLAMMGTLMLTSKGVAGVPRAALVILSGTLASFGLPLEGVTLILGVEALMDMARTSVNVLGNCLASAVVARWEGVDLNAPERIEPVLHHS
jgi:proton glutamate symport protein